MPDALQFESASEADTTAFAQRLAAHLHPRDVIALDGPLGAGKTRLVQGLAAALGCTADFVASPTFTLVHEYDGPLPLYHMDAYRLADSDEFRDLGGEELLDSDGVLCIEWAERIADVLPRDVLTVQIGVVGPENRQFGLSAVDGRGLAVLEQLSRE